MAETNGDPVCPHCGCMTVYAYSGRPVFKRKASGKLLSITTGALFPSRKQPVLGYSLAIAIFVNAVKGISALQLGGDLSVQYRRRSCWPTESVSP